MLFDRLFDGFQILRNIIIEYHDIMTKQGGQLKKKEKKIGYQACLIVSSHRGYTGCQTNAGHNE